MREEAPRVSVMAVVHRHQQFPGDPYELWLRDELDELLDLPHDGTRVEIIDGEIVVSPAPSFPHNAIIRDIQEGLTLAKAADSGFPWTYIATQDLNLREIRDGYIPDLCVLDRETDRKARAEHYRKLLPEHLTMAVEVTSSSNASDDRPPGDRRRLPTKWNGYARVGLPFYLLIDRAPEAAAVTLYSDPISSGEGRYRRNFTWEFGDVIQLPEPLGFSFSTDEWEPWG
ncbi:Uma2 family endonuclease [Spirillospora sp. NPDC052269]